MRICIIKGCDRKQVGQGLCMFHYLRLRRYGCTDDPKRTPQERFDENYDLVPETTCWIWNKSCGPQGYGKISIDHKDIRAHRLSWELHHGPIPDGMLVCHHCDVPECVNPDHLFLGTAKDNTQDSIKKGRMTRMRSEDAYAVKLTRGKVAKIRQLRASGISYQGIANRFNVGPTCIMRVCKHITWR